MISELLGFIGTLIAGGAVAAEDYKRSSETLSNRSEAKGNGSSVYWDGNNKLRSTETNEQVFVEYRNGFSRYVGLKTGTVYKNTLDDKNKQFAGSRFIYKEFPTAAKGLTKAHLFDTKKNMPVKILSEPRDIFNNDFRQKLCVMYYTHNGVTFSYAESVTIMEDDPDFEEFNKYVGR